MSDGRSLRERLVAGGPATGVLLRMPSEELVEMAAVAGVDFVFLDCEHGPDDVTAIRRHIAAAALFGAQTLVRVGAGDHSLVLRVLDAGAAGIIVPHVDDAETARAWVREARYPPEGERGFALYSRAARYGAITADEHRRASANTLVVVMLESPQAVPKTAAIVGTRGVDGYMIGMSDLRASTGPDDPPVEESVRRIHTAASGGGSVRFDIVNSTDEAGRARADGAQVIVYNTTALLTALFRGLV